MENHEEVLIAESRDESSLFLKELAAVWKMDCRCPSGGREGKQDPGSLCRLTNSHWQQWGREKSLV